MAHIMQISADYPCCGGKAPLFVRDAGKTKPAMKCCPQCQTWYAVTVASMPQPTPGIFAHSVNWKTLGKFTPK